MSSALLLAQRIVSLSRIKARPSHGALELAAGLGMGLALTNFCLDK
jgi:hypothetical protein